MSIEPVLLARGIDAFYGTSQALFGLDLQVMAGQVMALLGRNGAGKTTTMRAMMGMLPVHAGTIQCLGHNIGGLPTHLIARRGIGYVPEDRQIFAVHTVEENLEIAEKAGPHGGKDWSIERIYKLFPILHERRAGPAGRLSGGEQQMLSIARTLMGNPEILLLDEPSEGLSPIMVNQIAEVIRTFRRAGLTVVLAEQNMHFCLAVASDVTIVSKGTAVFTGTVDEFRVNEDVKLRHLTA